LVSTTTIRNELRALRMAVSQSRKAYEGTIEAPPSPFEWAKANATLVHPSRGLVPFVPYWYQQKFLENYNEPRRFVLKARQIGFSQVFAIEALYTAIHEPQATILLVSRNQALAANMLRYCYVAYHNLRTSPPLRKRNQSEMEFENGSRILSLPANPSAGRGYAANIVYLDEFAYAGYDEEIYQSISPALAQGGRLVIGSTPNGVGNLFAELYQQQSGFRYFVHPWHHCPLYYTPEDREANRPYEETEWYKKERPRYTLQQWNAEFECNFVLSGVAVFNEPDILRATEGTPPEVAPMRGHDYIISVDVGRRQDATVINVVDVTDEPYTRVYHERIERIPYPVIQQKIESVWHRYGGLLIIESNGVGDPVIENLGAPATPFVTSNRSKTQAITALQFLLEQGRFKAAWTDQERRELIRYQWDDRDLVQDCVMSLAIAAWHLHSPHEVMIASQAKRVEISRW